MAMLTIRFKNAQGKWEHAGSVQGAGYFHTVFAARQFVKDSTANTAEETEPNFFIWKDNEGKAFKTFQID